MTTLSGARADAPTALRLPAIISDHMVLQQDQPNPLWGWAPAGTPIKAEFVDGDGKTVVEADTTSTADGKWSLKLPALPSKSAGQLRFSAGMFNKTVQDVLVGEAWLCGGQSNMTYDFGFGNIPPAMIDTAKQEATAANGAIRFFVTGGHSADTPQDDSYGNWFVVTPATITPCSCVAWNFAVALREKMDRPMGMIVCAVGGTRADQWMSKATYDTLPFAAAQEKITADQLADVAPKIKIWQDADTAWLQANPTPAQQDQNKASRPVRHFWPPPAFAEFYNGMLHGLEPYGVKGVIWFQADGDLGRTNIYGQMIKALITEWRADFQAELPFYYVEMNNMRDNVQDVPVKYNELSQLREAQDAALELPKTDVVSSIDVGLPEPEPHFPNKKPVGQRLALLALDHDYGFPCVCHSPTFDSFTIEGNKVRVHFKYADGLRVRGGGEMKGFAIRGSTGDWVWAKGQVDGQDVLLSSDAISQPAAARYAWAANPVTSMENGAGLPMRPFRTDKDSPQ